MIECDSLFDRSRQRVYWCIIDRPGVSLSELAPKTQRLTGEQRRQLLAELVAAGRIVERMERPTNGPIKATYWPANAT